MLNIKLSKNFEYLKASSIIESIIAIVIISVCSLVALTVYLNVINQNNSIYYYEAKHKVEKLAYETELKQDFEDDSYNYNGYTIKKNVTVKKQEGVAVIDYVITSGNKNYSIKKLIVIEKEN